MREKLPCVYLLASRMHGTWYVGVTSNLVQRICQHCDDVIDGFGKQHRIRLPVWHEAHDAMPPAITREK